MKHYTKLGFAAIGTLVLIVVFSKLPSSTFEFNFLSTSLSRIVQNNLSGTEGQFAVYIEDLSSGEVYSLNSAGSFPAASLYKVYLLAAVFKEMEEARLKMEDRLSASKEHLIEAFGDLDFGYDPPAGGAPEQIEYSVEEALQRVGRISDNFATIMLAEKIGWDKVQAMAESMGTKNTSITDPIQTTAEDMALFFKKLYKKEIVSVAVSEEVEKYLSLSQLNDRIPAGIPEGVKVVHKTGELARIRHDGGIVYLADRPYILVLMSKDLQFEDEGVETLAKISQDVYDYFKNKSK